MIVTLAAAAFAFWLAFDVGSYPLESRAPLGIAVWWLLGTAIAAGLWPLARPPRSALAVAGLLAGLAVLTLASTAWAPSAERAFTEFNRVALYLGVFLLAVFAVTRARVGQVLDGVAAGIAGIGLLALASRLFPDVLPAGQVPDFLPSAYGRLSWPVEYWNGLAILVSLAFPLLLRIATGHRTLPWRALAVAPFPALAAVLYLTSSRGGFASAFAGLAAFLVLTPRRWPGLAASTLGGAGSTAAIAVLLARDALVDDPQAAAAIEQGRMAALLIALACLAVGAVFALGVRFLEGEVRIPRLAGPAVAVGLAVAALAVVIVADPIERFEAFKEPPAAFAEEDFTRAHLLSGNGSGRWQFWSAAVDELQADPVLGGGAGSYELWWAQHGTVAMFARDAHSLYLETLGELGILGFLLLAGAFLVGTAAGARRYLAAAGEERLLLATLLAAFIAYALAAGIDWMWELTAVSVVGIAFLAFLTGPATAPAASPLPRRPLPLAIAAAVIGLVVAGAQAVPFLAELRLSQSRAASRDGDADEALAAAASARDLEPWAASPHLQQALVHEAVGDLERARRSIREAIDRDPENWRHWLVLARIETKAGDIAAARRAIERAAALNPRSPLFARLQ